MELIIEIMTHLDRVGLESFSGLLHTPLRGLVQYATGPNVVSPREHKGIRSMSLSDLDQHPSMINIIDIVGMESMSDTQISELCKALSKSINHISISEVEESLFRYDVREGEGNKIFTLINSLPDSSRVVIRDSKFVGLNDGSIDLSRISFKNIENLQLQRCGFRGRAELEIENVGALWLMDFSNEMIDSIDLERGNMNAFYVWGAAVKLENRTINTHEFRGRGGLDLQNVKFTGTCATFSSTSDLSLSIKGFDAPNLYELSIVFREESPPRLNLNAPLLHRVKWSLFGTIFGTANVRQYQEEDFIFLREIRELELRCFLEPLRKIDLHRLSKLFLQCNLTATDVEREFPSLKELVISLSYCYIERIPVIKAENLESLEIIAGDKFRISSIIPTIHRYPNLKVFSFKNCGCSFLTRRWVEMSLYWMKWRTPCNLKEVRCGKSASRCYHRFWGL
jgi:hypothetical protein